MTETLLNIADAVVAELNTVVLPEASLPGTAQRLYLPHFDLPEMADLHVSVVPKSLDITQAARAVARHDHQIDIAVQQRADPRKVEELDPLLQLVGTIETHFRGGGGSGGRRLTSFPGAAWVGSRFEPIYATEHLETLRQFTSVLTLTFRCLTSNTGGGQ